MADRDEALHYLLNKLKSEDGWSGSNLAWNEDKLSIIADQFSSFDGVAKVKVLLSFIGMTPRTINQCSNEMLQILRLARRDGDEWVRLFASVLSQFPTNQTINVDQITEGGLEGLRDDVCEALNNHAHSFTPHEYAYLNHTVLQASHNFAVPSGHQHFVLKSQPQASTQLRNEMIQRAGTNFSQTGSLIKDRHLLQRQMSTSSGSGPSPFVSTKSSSSRKSVPIPGMSNKINRERGTKLLDIDEVPMANKRKRKLVPEDLGIPAAAATGRPEPKNKHARLPSKGKLPDTPTPVATTPAPPTYVATPDYAAGLGLEYEPMSPAYGVRSPEFEGQGSSLSVGLKKEPPVPPVIPPLTPTFTPGIDKPAELPLFGRPAAPATPTTPLPPPTPTGEQMPQPTNQTAAAKQTNKGLKLSRQQLAIAQEMFKESPSLTREHKALILGFMAGSRENPNPSQPVMTIKLNSKQDTEEVALPSKEGSPATRGKRTIIVETVFEMNYSNGQWRKLQLKRTFPIATAP